MKNNCLIKVTFIVVAVTIATSLVNANTLDSKIIPVTAIDASVDNQFEQLDLDKNNLLSMAEVAKEDRIQKAFSIIDLDNDAKLSKDEFTKFITK